MARETFYLVQAFKQGKGTRLTADTPVRCRSSEVARKKAEDLAQVRAGVVALRLLAMPNWAIMMKNQQ